jgi:hypothetical protein
MSCCHGQVRVDELAGITGNNIGPVAQSPAVAMRGGAPYPKIIVVSEGNVAGIQIDRGDTGLATGGCELGVGETSAVVYNARHRRDSSAGRHRREADVAGDNVIAFCRLPGAAEYTLVAQARGGGPATRAIGFVQRIGMNYSIGTRQHPTSSATPRCRGAVLNARGHAMQQLPDLDQPAINTIRMLVADAVQIANFRHPGTPMDAVPAASTLWQRPLRYDPSDPAALRPCCCTALSISPASRR